MTITIKVLLMACSLVGVTTTALALELERERAMSFHGTLIEPPPCTIVSINDGDRVDVDFGDRVGVNKVDGVNYRKSINYQISCGDVGSSNWALMLSLSGSVAGFDGQALQTDKGNLGIRIYQNDKPFTPNSTLKINLANQPRLEAVPVKKAGSKLNEGAFEAWATLRADYL
ncbi:TPA: fimbrial protein [Serratia fonticola]|uniref:fimbrial protein n=1 Tax=Serratia fonticola TaxID=47917 RepID=UPI0021778F4B|nr:fimbrial protein [Serratia fonticola]CAI2007004.1 putative minor fimbrial subunit StfF [Serratia fonticola]